MFSGTLTTVEALIASGVAGPPLNVSIYKSNAGIPNELLGTKEFPASEFANPFASNNRKIIDFSSFQISLVAGSQYLVGFETPFGIDGVTGSGSPFFAGWAPEFFGGIPTLSLGINLSSAVNGVDWAVASNSKELGIAVRATPEPSVTFLGLAILSVGLIRRHHNRG